MNKEDILKMTAGKELDWEVAKFMGVGEDVFNFAYEAGNFNYSTNISAAWGVVEKYQDYGVVHTPTRGHYCFIQTHKKTYQSPSCVSAPEAICKAALLAVMD